MRLAWAFFKRDALIAMSYKASLTVQLLGNVLLLGIFYFIGELVNAGTPPAALAPYGGSYLAFMLIGIALTDCVGVSLTTFAREIREGQLTGTLEATMMSPVRLPAILLCSSLWSYFFSAFRFVLYVVLGAVFYKVRLAQANMLSAAAIFLLTVLCFAGVGILWASVILLLKRGEAILSLAGLIVIVVSGVVFPRQLLPGWLQTLAEAVPLTHALDGMRRAVLRGESVHELASILATLSIFAVVLLAAGLTAFDRAVTRAKRMGSLVEF
jgi:ABC-2 type transport system permease protein